jgi:UDP-2,3-diacylglucosamine pyrophosphatase LpxH
MFLEDFHMLVIISDIHLMDGTCGKSIPASAFSLFIDRLRELAFNASWRVNGTYRPIKEIDILLMGDILDPLHSTLWLETKPGEPGYVRPWTDSSAPEYATTVLSITRNILQGNATAVRFIKGLSGVDGLSLPPATLSGQPDMSAHPQEPVTVRLHYMVGNHDWYYHLPGPAFDAVRQEIVDAFGLSNPPGPFPHELSESNELPGLLAGYEVYARHGDMYDAFNYSKEKGRNSSTLGDAFAVEIINRFPLEVERRMNEDLPPGSLENLHDLVNVRPVLATPLWIGSQLRQNAIGRVEQQKLKDLWNEICDEFLALPFVQENNKPYKWDMVDKLKLAIRITDHFSFKTIDDIVVWARKLFNPENITFARYALNEEAFLNHSARFVVYGHTHHHEIVPLDSIPGMPRPTNQMYINSGTWHTFFDLAINKPEEQKFIPCQVLTYLTFYKNDERLGRCFETWSGSFSD